MTLEDLTLGDNNGIKIVTEMPALIQVQSANISVLKGMLSGTDSDEWLLKANNNLLKKFKNG